MVRYKIWSEAPSSLIPPIFIFRQGLAVIEVDVFSVVRETGTGRTVVIVYGLVIDEIGGVKKSPLLGRVTGMLIYDNVETPSCRSPIIGRTTTITLITITVSTNIAYLDLDGEAISDLIVVPLDPFR